MAWTYKHQVKRKKHKAKRLMTIMRKCTKRYLPKISDNISKQDYFWDWLKSKPSPPMTGGERIVVPLKTVKEGL